MPRSIALLVAVGFVTGCFDPSYRRGRECNASGLCPSGYTCNEFNECVSSGPLDGGVGSATDGGSRVDAGAAPHDASLPDAGPECGGDQDCEIPPAACLQPGTCDTGAGTCLYPVTDCSDHDTVCSEGVCDPSNGSCVARPANEGATCAPESCGAYGECTGFTDMCDESGQKTRLCTTYACGQGACAGATAPDTASCPRQTTGIPCGDPIMTCGPCSFSSVCDEVGSRSCTTTTYACSAGGCASSQSTSTQTCTRDTDGNACPNSGVCVEGVCTHPCVACPPPPVTSGSAGTAP